ncbi:J domain-containing protein, partial [Haematococcus lacustris]
MDMEEPAKAVLEMQQCVAQAMPLSVRKPQGKPADASTLLAQLPHLDQEGIKKLRRRKILSIKDLADLSDAERAEALAGCGVTSPSSLEDINTLLSVLPTVHMRAEFEMEGEEEIMEQDVA